MKAGFTRMVTLEHSLLMRNLLDKEADGVRAFLRMGAFRACEGKGPEGWGEADRTMW